MTSLKGKMVFITGSSSGIGRATALFFAKEGCRLIITYHKDKKEGLEVAQTCKEYGAPDILLLQLDMMNNKSIQNGVKMIIDKFGKIDILINNAGVLVEGDLDKQSFEGIENQVRTNLEGLIKMTKACLPYISETIINIASEIGKIPYKDLSVYCASKFGVRGFTQTLALEFPKLALYNVNPTSTATKMNNFEGMPPEKVAQVIINTAKGLYAVENGGDVDVWEKI